MVNSALRSLNCIVLWCRWLRGSRGMKHVEDRWRICHNADVNPSHSYRGSRRGSCDVLYVNSLSQCANWKQLMASW